MADKIFDVTIITTKTVRVRVPADMVEPGEDPSMVAEEFALGGKLQWSGYVISEDGDYEIDSTVEVPPKPVAATLSP
jgi:hypothetical protein